MSVARDRSGGSRGLEAPYTLGCAGVGSGGERWWPGAEELGEIVEKIRRCAKLSPGVLRIYARQLPHPAGAR